MRATTFEYRHQALLHLLLVGLVSLTYVTNRLDIVWALVRDHADSGNWERLIFGIGAFILFVSAALETWANARHQAPVAAHNLVAVIHSQEHQKRLARILLVLTIGLLLPLPGTILLLTGEAILMLRLFFRTDERAVDQPVPSSRTRMCWRSGFRVAASRWGLTASMIAFVWTLQDRVAEIGAACSAALWVLLNVRLRRR